MKPIEIEDITDEFEEAYENGDQERLNELWSVFSKAVSGNRQDVLNSLLDDLSNGLDVKPFLKTMPEDIEFDPVPGMGEKPKDEDMPPFLQGGAF